ncbi:hypothetical protein BT96DRAFT_941108 [Gymnopus androsaceus JB14]|uniref:Uncharacterized protein n=1 Tax=Gymnopus androsaceus JB14 TaxID=1447944 RepID=A0A6A4HI12_9AGAR|nr:hypothetical protein BT96DRAFT_941108 [Gymnopus androsaceus JB14]
MANYKYWMSHADHKDTFREEHEEMVEDDPPENSERVAKMCEIMEELYELQPEEVKGQMAEENESQYLARWDAFKKMMSGGGFSLEELGDLDEAAMKLCCQNLTKFIQPLLNAIRVHTGLWLMLLLGAPTQPPAKDFTLLAGCTRSNVYLHAVPLQGETSGSNATTGPSNLVEDESLIVMKDADGDASDDADNTSGGSKGKGQESGRNKVEKKRKQ